MIFQHTIKTVLDGTKTQTCRIVKPGEYLADGKNGLGMVATHNKRHKWQVGNTYAVQPGRGKKAVARIRILTIRQADVRGLCHDDYVREGFNSDIHFLHVWCKMHDPGGFKLLKDHYPAWGWILQRPGERYNAWVLGFEVAR